MSADIDYYYTPRDAFDSQHAEILMQKAARASAASGGAATPRGAAAVVSQVLSAAATVAAATADEEDYESDDDLIIITDSVAERKIAGTRRVQKSKFKAAVAFAVNAGVQQQQQDFEMSAPLYETAVGCTHAAQSSGQAAA